MKDFAPERSSPSSLLIAFVAAIGITSCILILMTAIILSNDLSLNKGSPIFSTDIIMPKKKIETFKKIAKPKRPETKIQPPPLLPKTDISITKTTLPTPKMLIPSLTSNIQIQLASFSQNDGEYLPLIKIAPIYPYVAIKRGVEGYVDIKFTVNKDGTVSNPKVIDAKPKKYFERAALRAVMKFKYRPRKVDGVAIEVKGVTNRFTFVLEE